MNHVEVTLHNPVKTPSFVIRKFPQALACKAESGFLVVIDADNTIYMWPQSQIFEVVVRVER